jgi:hypothetical protein
MAGKREIELCVVFLCLSQEVTPVMSTYILLARMEPTVEQLESIVLDASRRKGGWDIVEC